MRRPSPRRAPRAADRAELRASRARPPPPRRGLHRPRRPHRDRGRVHRPRRRGSSLARRPAVGARGQGGPRAAAGRRDPGLDDAPAVSARLPPALRHDRNRAGLRGRTAAALRARRGRHSDPPPDGARSIDRTSCSRTARRRSARSSTRSAARTPPAGPVLVGTATVTESEGLAQRLRDAGVACEVLNAKNDAEEAPIVARAGAFGAVTIATNMAGRGTDIRLGGAVRNPRRAERVAALGGLYVIGTNRHESRRVDLQLRGRAGRQGDPGESRFFVSLEDDLLVRYGIHCFDSGAISSREVRRSPSRARSSGVKSRGRSASSRVRTSRFAGRWRATPLCSRSSIGSSSNAGARFCLGRTSRTSGRARPSAARRSWRRRGAGRRRRRACGDARLHRPRVAATIWRSARIFARASTSFGWAARIRCTRFTSEAIQAFSQMDDAIDEAVLAALADGAGRRRSSWISRAPASKPRRRPGPTS